MRYKNDAAEQLIFQKYNCLTVESVIQFFVLFLCELIRKNVNFISGSVVERVALFHWAAQEL